MVEGEEPLITNKLVGQFATAYYFLHFFIIVPLPGLIETPRPRPTSISEDVLAKNKAKGDASTEPQPAE